MKRAGLALVLLALGLLAFAACSATSIGKEMVLRPWRRGLPPAPEITYRDVVFRGEGIDLHGWVFPAQGERRGIVVYLHGHGDNRRGGVGIARRFTPSGFDVVAYHSRAHGQSGGDACTHGVHERRDLARVLDALEPGPVVLIGGSLGAAIALQAAADDPRITLVVAIAPFSDLRTLVHERAPFFFGDRQIEAALELAGREADFSVDEASPVATAPRIRCPLVLVHGLDDSETSPDHTLRIQAALTCPNEMLLLPGVGHNDPLDGATWTRIEQAVDDSVLMSDAGGHADQTVR